jgi:hypothetical protein
MREPASDLDAVEQSVTRGEAGELVGDGVAGGIEPDSMAAGSEQVIQHERLNRAGQAVLASE